MFRTEIPLTPLPHQLPPSARVLTLGSCFSDSIGARLTEFKVATMVNPFGTVFNPLSACKLLRAAAGEDVDWQQHLVEARGRWQSYDLHAEIGADSPVDLLQHINRLTREVGVFLATADVVVLTLGSAYVYRLRETGELVSNCHKIPADQFDKELLTADEMIAAVAETHAYLRRINPKLRFVLTVSPVRHLKDTLILNSASKAMLRVACHYLSELLPDVTYFPAYELLVDDLRDYRFYATDMLHLSETAENYVWEKFTRTYFDAAFGRFKKEWEGIRQNLGHRPLHAAAPEHRAFLESTLERLRKLGSSADVRMELLHVERELANLPEPKALAPIEEEIYDDGEERIDIGSFDDQAAIDEAQPLAAASVAAALAQVAPNKENTKQATSKAESTKPRLTSQASLIRPGSGLLVEDAEETGYETEDSETDDAPVSSDSAYDHAYSPTITDLTDESEADEDDTDEEEPTGPETAEEAAHRKKRRSRGGAKRTKRKHARLAAEQVGTEGQPETTAVAIAPAPLPDETLLVDTTPIEGSGAETPESESEPASEVVYVTEAELRQPRPRPEAVEPVAATSVEPTAEADTEQDSSQADEKAPEARRGRNNRRGNKREQAPRYGGRPGRQPLYAVDTDSTAPADANQPLETAATPPRLAVVEPVLPAPVEAVVTPAPTEEAAVATPNPEAVTATADAGEKPATPKRSSRPKAAKAPVAKPTAPAESMPVTADLSESATVGANTAEAAVTVVPTKPARRKPAAKPKAQSSKPAVPVQAAVSEAISPPAIAQATPVAEPAAKEPTRAPAVKRPAAKPKAAVKPKVTAKPEETLVAPAAPAAKTKATVKAKAPVVTAAAAVPKAATKKAPAKAKPTATAKTATPSDKAPDKSRAKAAAKPRKKAEPKAPEDK